MKGEKTLLRLILIGFIFSFLISELTKFYTTQRLLFSFYLTFIISLLAILPLIPLILWSRARLSKDIYRMLLAIVPSMILIYLIQYLAPTLGWWKGPGVRLNPVSQSIIYGTPLIGLVIGLIALYRYIARRNKRIAVIFYFAAASLILLGTYLSDLFQRQAAILYDLFYSAGFLFTPLVFYEILNSMTVTEFEQAEELNTALDRINHAIHSTLDYDEILSRVIEEAAGALRAESAAIAVREKDHWSGRYQFGLLKSALPRLTEDEVKNASFAMDLKTPIGINEVIKDKRFSREVIDKYHFRSMLAIPLRVREEFLGALTFNYHTHTVAFSKEQLGFARKLQTTVSLALENARLYGIEKQISCFNDALNNINLAISSTRDIDKIMNLTIKESAKAISCETAAITLREDESWVLRYNYGFSKKYIGMRFTEEEAKHTVYVARTGEPLVINDALHDDRINTETAKALGIRSVAIIPLVLRDRIIGVLSFNYHSDAIAFNDAQIDFLKKVAVSLSLALDNAQLYENQRNIANTLQEAVLELPQKIKGLEFSHLYRSATRTADVGGDFYDIFVLEHERIAILTGDVSGKGLEAATLTSLVKNTVKAYALEDGSAASIINKTNDVLYRESSPSTFVTLFFCILDLTTGNLQFCNAGHLPAIFKPHSSDIALLSTGSPIIGAFPNMEYSYDEIHMKAGDTLLLYTDGVTEAKHNRTLFGEDRLIKIMEKPHDLMKLPQLILNDVLKFSNNKLSDDIAILAISMKQ